MWWKYIYCSYNLLITGPDKIIVFHTDRVTVHSLNTIEYLALYINISIHKTITHQVRSSSAAAAYSAYSPVTDKPPHVPPHLFFIITKVCLSKSLLTMQTDLIYSLFQGRVNRGTFCESAFQRNNCFEAIIQSDAHDNTVSHWYHISFSPI